MDTKKPYWLTLLLALDRFGAALLFNRPDLTISTLCWMVLTVEGSRRNPVSPTPPLLMVAWGMLRAIDPYPWQCVVLRLIGRGLEWLSPGHCNRARVSDMALLIATAQLLGVRFPTLAGAAK